MAYKRILTIQDISCVGQCSMTVALPILSACGHETCIFPTAVLSTHTGGFGKPEVIHMDGHLESMLEHWKKNDLKFDCILVGYLGSEAAVDAASWAMENMLEPGGIRIVDPAMADHGNRYSGLSEAYCEKMIKLCRSADIIIPNVTEAAMMAGTEYQEILDETYVQDLLKRLGHPCVVLTGVGYRDDQTGAAVYENGRYHHISHSRFPRSYHGTGDMFAACFTGALMQGKDRITAVKIAGEFVMQSIANTIASPVHWYGVKFETALPKLIRLLDLEKAAD